MTMNGNDPADNFDIQVAMALIRSMNIELMACKMMLGYTLGQVDLPIHHMPTFREALERHIESGTLTAESAELVMSEIEGLISMARSLGSD